MVAMVENGWWVGATRGGIVGIAVPLGHKGGCCNTEATSGRPQPGLGRQGLGLAPIPYGDVHEPMQQFHGQGPIQTHSPKLPNM